MDQEAGAAGDGAGGVPEGALIDGEETRRFLASALEAFTATGPAGCVGKQRTELLTELAARYEKHRVQCRGREFKQEQLCRIILQQVKTNMTNAEFAGLRLRCLFILARNTDNKVEIAGLDGIETAVACMRSHEDDTTVQKYSALLMVNLSHDNDTGTSQIGSTGGIAAVVHMMDRHAENASLLEDAFAVLWNATHSDLENKALVRELGGITRMVSGMNRFIAVASLQTEAYGALQNICCGYEANKEAFLEAGGVGAVLDGMKHHHEDEKVVVEALSTLMNTTVDSSGIKEEIRKLGGVGVVLSAMRNHSKNAKIQQDACGTIRNVTHGMSTENKSAVRELSTFKHVFQAMETHPDDADVHGEACAVLQNLVCNNEENAHYLREHGAVEAIVRSMSRHSEHRDVQRTGSGALWNMSFYDDCLVYMDAVGSLREVLKASTVFDSSNDLPRRLMRRLDSFVAPPITESK